MFHKSNIMRLVTSGSQSALSLKDAQRCLRKKPCQILGNLQTSAPSWSPGQTLSPSFNPLDNPNAFLVPILSPSTDPSKMANQAPILPWCRASAQVSIRKRIQMARRASILHWCQASAQKPIRQKVPAVSQSVNV